MGSFWFLWSGFGGKEKISFWDLILKNFFWGEKVIDVKSG